jgi:hypothetical protein
MIKDDIYSSPHIKHPLFKIEFYNNCILKIKRKGFISINISD